jgi:hypothetical protein
MTLEIELVRHAAVARVYFGADASTLAFGNPDTTGLLNIVLELEAVTPTPKLAVDLDNDLKEPVHITYMERTCLDKTNAGQALTFDVSESRFSSPRYIFVVCVKNDRNLFRHSDVNYIQVAVDSEAFPNLQQSAKFLENRF